MSDQAKRAPSTDELAVHFSELSAVLGSSGGGPPDPARVVRVAQHAVPHALHCGLTVLRKAKGARTIAESGPTATAVDRLQYQLHQGPCLDAAVGEAVVLSDDLTTDARWPRFGPRCAEDLGVLSMLSVRVPVGGTDHAALNFYAESTDAFGEVDVPLASLFAPFAGLAVEYALREQDVGNLEAALTSSRQIGTAIGILMARRRITSEEAFDVLRRASQSLNLKLREVAAEVELTGEVPQPPSDG